MPAFSILKMSEQVDIMARSTSANEPSSTVGSSAWSIVGKICLVTGANSGIGKYTAMELARRGAKRVILACRNVERGEEAVRDIWQQIGEENRKGCQLVVRQVDLASMASVRQFACEILANETQLDVLVNNAGVLQRGNTRELTKDGFEVTFQTNFLGPFLLTNLLLDLLKKAPSARVVMVTSQAYLAAWPNGYDLDDVNQANHMKRHGGKFSYWRAYSQSKLAIILFTRYLHQKLNSERNTNISVFTLHPGEIRTNITRHHALNFIKVWLKFLGTDANKGGAKVPLYCACKPGLEIKSGQYFDERCKVRSLLSFAKDDAKADQLVQLCLQWTGLKSDGTTSKFQ